MKKRFSNKVKMTSCVLLATLFAVTLGCQSGNENTAEIRYSDTVIDNENFKEFLYWFSKDSNFQKSRLGSPFIISFYDQNFKPVIDTFTVKDSLLGEWECIDFIPDTASSKLPVDKYEPVIENRGDTATYLRRGIGNGIYIQYIFVRTDGQWYMCGIEDESN